MPQGFPGHNRPKIAAFAAELRKSGQQASTAAKPPPRTLRVWPVGDAPPFMQEVRDGVRHELEPPPGSIPPRRVTVGLADQPGQEEQAAELRLMLGRLGEAVPVPVRAGLNTVYVRLVGGGQSIRVTALTPDLNLCLGAASLGSVVPVKDGP